MSKRVIWTCDACGRRAKEGEVEEWLTVSVNPLIGLRLILRGVEAQICSMECARAVLYDDVFLTRIEEERP